MDLQDEAAAIEEIEVLRDKNVRINTRIGQINHWLHNYYSIPNIYGNPRNGSRGFHVKHIALLKEDELDRLVLKRISTRQKIVKLRQEWRL